MERWGRFFGKRGPGRRRLVFYVILPLLTLGLALEARIPTHCLASYRTMLARGYRGALLDLQRALDRERRDRERARAVEVRGRTGLLGRMGYALASGLDAVTGSHLAKDLRQRDEAQAVAEVQWERQHFQEVLQALYFIDSPHATAELLGVFLGRERLADIDIAHMYDGKHRVGGIFGHVVEETAFENYTRAKTAFSRGANPKQASLQRLKKLHVSLMQGGVDGMADEELGTLRYTSRVGVATAGITAEALANIRANPYTDWLPTTEHGANAGLILYPCSRYVKPEALKRIRGSDHELVRAIEAQHAWQTRENKSVAALYTPYEPEEVELTQKLVAALVQERFDSYNAAREKLGKVDSPAKIHKLIGLVAQLERDLVSIHPFGGGNGRTMRLQLYLMLEAEGLPAPRLADPDLDIYAAPAQWHLAVANGVVATQRLQTELTEQARLGLPLRNSPELLSPAIPRTIEIRRIRQGRKRPEPGTRTAVTDGRQFAAFIKTKLSSDKALAEFLETHDLSANDALFEEFKKFEEAHRIDYEHETKGLEQLSLNLVDPDFAFAFGQNWASDPAKWKRKMELWYSSEVLWRGISYDVKVTEDEVLGMFTRVHGQFMCNRFIYDPERAEPRRLQQSIQEVFERYNQDLLDGEVWKVAMDHHTIGPLYESSYGYSLSKSYLVAKAYAMGAQVITEGRDMKEQLKLQDQLSARIVVGVYRSEKDVDLARLRLFEPEFRYRHARQQEVMGIGAADPDSVMVVHSLDAKGKVIVSYVRNPKKPGEVWVVPGDFRPGQSATPPKGTRVVKLPL